MRRNSSLLYKGEFEIMCGIYKVTNRLNHKIYIGKSVDIKRRWQDHIRESKVTEQQWSSNYRGVRTPFHSAIRKYGAENFTFEVLEECDEEQLNNKERYWIKKLNSTNRDIGYNVTLGGDGYNCRKGEDAPGCKITKEECDFIKQKLKERWTAKQIKEFVPLATPRIISAINYGETWFDENEEYPISINNGHRSWSDDEAMKIKQRYAKGETINDLALEFNVRYESISNLVKGKSYTNLPVLKREVNWQRIGNNRNFTEEEVLFYRKEFYMNKKSIKSLHESSPIKRSYAAFYNMIKGITYKNIGGLPNE